MVFQLGASEVGVSTRRSEGLPLGAKISSRVRCAISPAASYLCSTKAMSLSPVRNGVYAVVVTDVPFPQNVSSHGALFDRIRAPIGIELIDRSRPHSAVCTNRPVAIKKIDRDWTR